MKKYLIVIVATFLFSCNSQTEQNQQQQKIEENTDILQPYQVKTHKLPDTMFFAGEQILLDRFDIKESLDRELMVNTYWHL